MFRNELMNRNQPLSRCKRHVYRLGLAAITCVIGVVSGMRPSLAQSVCLPAPRLLTTMPMGGQAGTSFDVTISGQSLEGLEQLVFSNPGIVATPKLKDDGSVIANQFVVEIAEDCQPGVYDARAMAALGISSARAFSVGQLPEITQTEKCTTLETALEIQPGSIVNAVLVDRSINHYAFESEEGRRIVIDCAAKGIDSKMNPVVALADANGSDLIVERRGGLIDFTIPASGRYVIKVHDLTFKGGAYYFYRLAVTEVSPDEQARQDPVDQQFAASQRLPRTSSVASFSWPPSGLSADPAAREVEPNNRIKESQKIDLPCDLTGSFFPAADVDSFEFTAKKGEVWWVEVASERVGATDGCFRDHSAIGRRRRSGGYRRALGHCVSGETIVQRIFL